MSAQCPPWRQSLVFSHCQVLEEPPPAVQVRPMTLKSARVNIGSHGDFNASGMCKVLEKETESMHRLGKHRRSRLIFV